MKIKRQLNRKELRSLDREIGFSKKRYRRDLWFLGIPTLLFLVAIPVILFTDTKEPKWIFLLLAAALYFAVGPGVSGKSFIRERRRLKEYDLLRVRNEVTVFEVRSSRYYFFDEEEDEGVFYLFEVAPDELLFFGGQDYYPTRQFPSNEFEIVLGYSGGGELLLMEIYSTGEKITPLKKISGAEKQQLLSHLFGLNPDRGSDEPYYIKGKLQAFA